MKESNYVFYPKEIFLNINFDVIKSELSGLCRSYEDFGSLIVLNCNNYYVTVSNIGKIEVLFNNTCENNYRSTIQKIETAFRKTVPQFSIVQ